MTYNVRCKASLCTPGTPCCEANKTQNTQTGVVHAPMLHFRTCTQGRMLGLAAIRKRAKVVSVGPCAEGRAPVYVCCH